MLTRSLFPQACELCRLSSTSRSTLKSLHSVSASRAAVLPNHTLSFARAGPSATASSRHSISNTPKWSDESLSAVRTKYEAKYAERLKQKAKECVPLSVIQRRCYSILTIDDLQTRFRRHRATEEGDTRESKAYTPCKGYPFSSQISKECIEC